MKELDKTKSYYLGDLSEEQIEEVKSYLVYNSKNWSVDNKLTCKHISLYDELWFQEDELKQHALIINALELFDSKESSSPKQGKKESNGKCKFELDFEFIEAMSLRIENETKYEPYNWKLPLNTDELANALLRHAIEVKKGNFDDNGELGHLMAIANNAMFLYYQLKNNK